MSPPDHGTAAVPANATTRTWTRALDERPVLAALVLAVLTVLLFSPVARFDYLNFDDPDYVTENPHVQAGLTAEGVKWAFTAGHSGNWHPVTWLSHMLDRAWFGPGPAGPHLTNLVLHALNAALLLLLLHRLTGAIWPAAFVAAIFAFHPLRVESVAWVAERKDVLSTLFGLCAIGAYACYASRVRRLGSPGRGGRPAPAVACYGLSLGLFVLSLLSKPMLVTLPFLLLLLDFWPLGRLTWSPPARLRGQPKAAGADAPRPVDEGLGASGSEGGRKERGWTISASTKPGMGWLLLEKVPFLALAGASSVVTFLVQKHSGAVQSLTHMSLQARFENAVVAYARYLGKALWPADLVTPYPHPGHWPVAAVVGAAVLLVAGTAVAARFARKCPFGPVGWFWYLGTLVPVIGIVQVGAQSMADRYTYLPLVGIFILVAWSACQVIRRWPGTGRLWGGAAVLALLWCAMQTHQQLRYWRNSDTLFSHAIAASKDNWLAHYNLAWFYESRGRTAEAMAHYQEAVRIKPNCGEAWNNIGFIEAGRKDYPKAIAAFETALRARPDLADARNNLGKALDELGQVDAAVEQYELALQQKPTHLGALNNLAAALGRKGDWPGALRASEAALRLKPDQPATHYTAATAFARLGRVDQAIAQYRLAIQYKPDYAQAHNDLAIALASKRDFAGATDHSLQAVRLQTNDPAFLSNLGKLLSAQQRTAEAIPVFEQAVGLAPTNADAHNALGAALANQGRLADAVSQFREAARLRPGHVPTLLNLGKALAASGQTNEAIVPLREAVRLRPDFAPAQQELRILEGAK